ncbi:cold-shock protein [Kordiimonas marina]|uniref:cold-shock protein n=1 Tax=Kordiimonas marina TaxID=2872312 RepID=UPI001FF3064F|nr:cold-shock protein [Kordiimonas marina]MCJ9430553.1 cold-shock protein [Kordiimonas marina]
MANGTVKWFNTTKGYGFIKPEEGGDDIFVHISALQRAGLETLADNQEVTYELVEDRRGRMSAGNIALR